MSPNPKRINVIILINKTAVIKLLIIVGSKQLDKVEDMDENC